MNKYNPACVLVFELKYSIEYVSASERERIIHPLFLSQRVSELYIFLY